MVEGTSLYSIWSLWNIVVHTRRSNLVLNDLSNWMRRSKDYNLGGWLAGCVFNNFFDRILGVFSWGTFLSLSLHFDKFWLEKVSLVLIKRKFCRRLLFQVSFCSFSHIFCLIQVLMQFLSDWESIFEKKSMR